MLPLIYRKNPLSNKKRPSKVAKMQIQILWYTSLTTRFSTNANTDLHEKSNLILERFILQKK